MADASESEGSTVKKGATRNVFTLQEDAKLHALVQKYGTQWNKISEEMGNRSVRQCRERYLNYLAPGVVNGPWSQAEDRLLIEKHRIFGRKWTIIAKFFHNRSGANIKNRWSQLVGNGIVPNDPQIKKNEKKQTKQSQSTPIIIMQTQPTIQQITAHNDSHQTVQLPPINELSKKTFKGSRDILWNNSLTEITEGNPNEIRRNGQNDLEKFRNFKGFAGLLW